MPRRMLLTIGAILVLVGVWVLIAKPEFERDREVLKLGELSATVRQPEPLPNWVAPLLIIVGGALAVAGAIRSR